MAGKPEWLRVKLPNPHKYQHILKHLAGLPTVCQSASCPNIGECFGRGTATIMILGDICTRNCGFCAGKHDSPKPLDPKEPQRVAQAIKALGLRYAVITSVTRDDLEDGGAAVFSMVIKEIRRYYPHCLIEVLIPDFGGSEEALAKVIAEKPEVINHNLETVPRLYSLVRPQADYYRSLGLLAGVKREDKNILTKSGLILGMGETRLEVLETIKVLQKAGCDFLTLGQYLQPRPDKLPVSRYLPPEEFQELRQLAIEMGFKGVEAGPLVRSSYRAEAQFQVKMYGDFSHG